MASIRKVNWRVQPNGNSTDGYQSTWLQQQQQKWRKIEIENESEYFGVVENIFSHNRFIVIVVIVVSIVWIVILSFTLLNKYMLNLMPNRWAHFTQTPPKKEQLQWYKIRSTQWQPAYSRILCTLHILSPKMNLDTKILTHRHGMAWHASNAPLATLFTERIYKLNKNHTI